MSGVAALTQMGVQAQLVTALDGCAGNQLSSEIASTTDGTLGPFPNWRLDASGLQALCERWACQRVQSRTYLRAHVG